MVDIAALSLELDSRPLLKAVENLDKFAGASAKAEKSASALGPSMQRMIDLVQSVDRKLGAIASTLDKIQSGMGSVSTATGAAAQAQRNAATAAEQLAKSETAVAQSATGATSATAQMAAATEKVGRALTIASPNAEKMALAAERITVAEKLAAQAGVQLSLAQMAAVGSGRDNAQQLVAQAAAAKELANESSAAATAVKQGAAAQLEQRRAAAGAVQGIDAVTKASGAQRAGLQQLSFQLNDIATMWSMGARPMQIFASQSGQVIQAVQMMTAGTSRLAACRTGSREFWQ